MLMMQAAGNMEAGSHIKLSPSHKLHPTLFLFLLNWHSSVSAASSIAVQKMTKLAEDWNNYGSFVSLVQLLMNSSHCARGSFCSTASRNLLVVGFLFALFKSL